MGQFKFLTQNIPDEPETVEAIQNRFMELVDHQLDNRYRQLIENRLFAANPLSINNRPAVFLTLNRGRATIDDNEWSHILQQQRRNLIEQMWEQGMIVQEIISQDMDGFSLRTEILF